MTPTTPDKTWRIAALALAAIALCYVGAGAPALSRLLDPAVIGEGLALKPITYHWVNHADRAIPEADLFASRFYVLVLAAFTSLTALLALDAHRNRGRFAFVLGWAFVMLIVLVNAQIQAFYNVG
jgi:ABC-type Na+ efflux pump permease subunit